MTHNPVEFMPIWEVETHYRCPVVGAVLTVEKHKQILKKCGYDIKKLKPYEYHQRLMSRLFEQNNVSIKVDNYLKSRAAKYMRMINGLPEKKIRRLWKEHSLNGNAGPLMYAIVSYKNSSASLLNDVYGEVHMQAHANMTQIHDFRKKLTCTEQAVQNEKEKGSGLQQKIKQLVQAGKLDRKKIKALEEKVLVIESKPSPQREPENILSQLQQDIRELESRLEEKNEENRRAEREKRSLQIELFSTRKENELLQSRMHEVMDAFHAFGTTPYSPPEKKCSSPNCSQEKCPKYQLCAKRIFMVGGITRMKSLYKDIVEKAGGHFDYHDGYLKSSSANLEARVRRSDVVICPVDCNSHNACLRVKKLCSRYNKELKILNGSSLSAVTQALFNPETPIVLN